MELLGGMTNRCNEENTRRTLDPVVVERLRSLHRPGHPPVLARLIDMYLASAPDLIGQIVTAVYYGDSEALKDAAHLLKSKSVNLGVEAVADVARELESFARGVTEVDTHELMSDLQREYERAVGELVRERPFTEA